MQLRDVIGAGLDHIYRWPSGDEEPYPYWIDYRAMAQDGEHTVRIGFGTPTAETASELSYG